MNPANIPAELRWRVAWVRWRNIERDGKATKVPIQASGEFASSTNPETWTTFKLAMSSLSREDSGVGFVFDREDPYCGIDLDGCRNPETGLVDDWAKKIIVAAASYAEVSPSETGVKIWVRGEWNHDQHKALIDGPKIGGKYPAIEIYSHSRYFAVTGKRLAGMTEIVDGQAILDILYREHFAQDAPVVTNEWSSNDAVIERCRRYLATLPPAISGQDGSGACYRAACICRVGFGLSFDEAMMLMREWNTCCVPPWSEKELRHKVDDAGKEPGPHGRLRDAAPQNYGKIKMPEFTEKKTEDSGVRITTLDESSMQVIEDVRTGRRPLVELGIPMLDSAIGGGCEFGEMVILSGRPNHGKSAIALQIVHHWTANGYTSAFISEEMSHIALGKRAVLFATDIPEEDWLVRLGDVESQVRLHFTQREKCFIVEQCGSADVAAEMIRKMASDGVRCIALDYAQLLRSPGKSSYEQVTYTSKTLRRVVNETGVVLLALAQLNRNIESRKEFKPCMADLRDSGQLEQDCDVFIAGVWPHRIDVKNPANVYQFFVMKNRNRGISSGAFEVCFEPSRQRFLEATEIYYSPE